MEETISIEAAAAMVGLSRSTLWRRVATGQMGKGGNDAHNRALLRLPEVLALLELHLSAADVQTLLQADAGVVEAQAETGAMFYVAGARKAALYWLRKAAQQNHADAMQWLGIAYADAAEGQQHTRENTQYNNNLAIMWIAKAASHSHVIAQEQLMQLLAERQGKSLTP